MTRQHGLADLDLALGDVAYAAAYQSGTRMSYDEIIEFALAQLGQLVSNP